MPAPPRGLGPWWIVLAGALLALALVAFGQVAAGGVVMAIALALGGVLRAVLPARAAGGLVGRSRAFDTAAMLAIAVACLLLAAVLKST